MLLLRPRHKSGGINPGRLPVHRVRSRKFGPVTHERQLKRHADIAIYGAHASGKSRWIEKLYQGAAEVWPARPALLIRALDPIGQWSDHEGAAKWHDATAGTSKPWQKLNQAQRLERLIAWTVAVEPVVLVDDAHKLNGRKADVAHRLINAAGIVVHAASEETRITQTLRMTLARRDPQVVRLSSDAAYDYTGGLTWFLCIVCAAMGAWPVAAGVAGLKVLGRGNRAARQN